MFVAIFVAIKRTESTRAFLYIQFSQYISRYTGTAAHATPADVASRFRGRANRSWSTRRAAFPTITSPSFSDQPTHDDDHVGEGYPEVYNPPFPLGAPHQLLVAFCQESVRTTTQRFVARSEEGFPFSEITPIRSRCANRLRVRSES